MATATPAPRPAKDEFMVATWPRRSICVPRGSLDLKVVQDLLNVGVHAAQVAPLHGGVDVDHRLVVVVGDQRGFDVDVHLRQIAEQFLRRLGGGEEIGMLSSACMESILYCGTCTATLYSMPLAGFTQNEGLIWKLELSVSSTLLATSCWLRPTVCARVRSTFRNSVG